MYACLYEIDKVSVKTLSTRAHKWHSNFAPCNQKEKEIERDSKKCCQPTLKTMF